MIEKLIERVFAARNAAHLEHWQTESFARHQATGEFYEGVIEKLDALVEARMGLFDVVGEVPGQSKNLTESMLKDVMWLTENRDAVCNGVTALENLYDAVVDEYLSTLFKLKRLR